MIFRSSLSEPHVSRGFTLIELLTVIAIIGILSSVAYLFYNDSRARGRDHKRVSDVKQIQLALELYYDANSAFPATLSALAPVYLGVIPTPPGGTDQTTYSYAATGSGGSCTGYHLGAALERTDDALLSEDNDDAGGASVCTGSAANFHGNAASCTGTTPGDPDPCYDMVP